MGILLSPREQSMYVDYIHETWFDTEGICKAQAKKLIEELEKPCDNHTHHGWQFSKKKCPECWAEIKAEVEDKK